MGQPPTRAETPPDPGNASTAECTGGLPDRKATPPLPTGTSAGLQEDVATVKRGTSR